MYKKISSWSEAIDCGGAIIFSIQAPARWIMYVGDTLKAALAEGKLGQVARLSTAFQGSNYRGFHRPEMDGWAGAPNVKELGGDLVPIYRDVDYFSLGPQAMFHVMGVVTSATEGYGIGSPATSFENTESESSLSYMATTIKMESNFGTYINGIKSTLMAAVPEKLRQYYESTYAAALDASYPLSRPTIAVPSFWKAGLIWNGALPTPAIQVKGQGGLTALAEISNPDVFANIPYNATAAAGWSVTVPPQPKYRVLHRPGYRGYGATFMPCMDFFTRSTFRETAPITGEIGGLKVGLMRDGHMLKRSLVDSVKFADQASLIPSLAVMVSQYLDRTEYLSTPVLATPTIDTAMVNLAREEAVGVPTEHVFELGNLSKSITKFSKTWDERARANAQAST